MRDLGQEIWELGEHRVLGEASEGCERGRQFSNIWFLIFFLFIMLF
jgi:hypothetical protein